MDRLNDGGLLVALEGIDGCGKSTQRTTVEALLAERRPGVPLHVFREPGGTALGEDVRGLLLRGAERGPLTELLLYMASRAELYAARVLPALAAGETVLLDRSHYSTAAYQGAGLGEDEAFILDLARHTTRGREPDRILWLDLDPTDAAARRAASGDAQDLIEARGGAYFERVAAAYGRYAAADPGRWRRVDARGTPDEVAARVREALADVR